MRLVRNPPGKRLCDASIVTIGNFDGLHLGHRSLIGRCQALRKAGEQVVVVTFHPSPQAFFRPDAAPARLTSSRGKLEALSGQGVDLVWMMRFDEELANQTAAAFAEAVFVDSLGARHVVIGEDFRFGHGREGDQASLREMGKKLGFEVDVVGAVEVGGERVSSTRIRAALEAGDLEAAAAMLGRPFTMQGRVARGLGLGHGFGYPTANISVSLQPCPLHGIFAVRARLAGGDWMDGVASLGNRPTVGGKELVLEVHLFDFEGSLYGQRLEVSFVRKLRDEVKFEGVDALIQQMHDDAAEARAVLAAAG